MPKKKLAVIGASHFQMPLIERAQEKGCEVHAFAWQCGDVGETAADVFHPVSITEVDQIVRICREVGVDGICTIASDLATVAVSHVAEELSLTGNSVACFEDTPVMSYAIDKVGMGLKIVAECDASSEFATPYGFAVNRGANAELLQKFNEGLAAIKADGTYDKIVSTYVQTAK